MNYHQLQTTLKALRNAGYVSQSFKLNQKKEVLQAEFDRIKAIALSKTLTETEQPQQTQTQTEPALQQPQDFSKLIKAYDNYIPCYELANEMGMNPKEFWKWAYANSRADKIELSTLQENFRYTSDQQRYQDPSGYFFVSFN